MKNKILVIILLLHVFVSYSNCQSIKLDSLDSFIQKLMSDFEVPGLAIGIVQNDSIIYAKGYGFREVNKGLLVDCNTTFGIGSISKSFTALTVGILVNEGKINWDDHVKDYLPYFELYDPYVTENFTIRDLLTHRSGLKGVSGGTLWYHSDLTRIDVIKGLKYLKPISGFRDKTAYQNVMYVVAGEIVKEVSGMPWDDFLKTRVFDKLKMKSSTSISDIREANNNIAHPYISDGNNNKVSIEQEKGDNLAEAGFVYSSVNDMSNYIKLFLDDGIFEKDTIVKKRIIDEIFRPQVIFPVFGPPINNEFSSYGFGWWLTPINGHKIIEHSGGIDGMSADVIMVKDLNLGVVVLTNTSEMAPFLLNFKILEQVLNDKSLNKYAFWKKNRDNDIIQKKDALKKAEAQRIKSTQPTLNLDQYTGKYQDKMYGDIYIKQLKDGTLEINFSHTPLFSGKLKHWHYDTFMIDWQDYRMPNGFLTFNFNKNGAVVGIKLDQQSLLDVDFDELDIKRLEN